MDYYLKEGILNDSSWQKIAELINKDKVEQKLLEPIGDDQYYRAVLIYKTRRYIAVGIFDNNIRKPVMMIKRI